MAFENYIKLITETKKYKNYSIHSIFKNIKNIEINKTKVQLVMLHKNIVKLEK